ncbi:MAG: TRAP transporter substrate-binding protein [Lachnospiraceae bacterium]|nr:TRAP transporter substrate-binding protein [Lachnospiraceae bacterium]
MRITIKKIFIALILILLAGIIGGLIYRHVSKEPAPEYVFTYAENQSDSFPTSLGAYYFADLVSERSGGRIKILVYTNGELGREADILRQMKYGGVDFARVSLSQVAEVYPDINILQMPYLYNDADHMWRVLDGPIGDMFLERMGDLDMVGLSWYDAGARSFYVSGDSVCTPEDMQGLRIRVQQSELMVDMVECLGAEPVPISYEEVYSALELGTIDGAENNWPSYEDMGHYKVADTYIVDEHTRVPEMQLCSENTWNMLSEEDREMIMQCAAESAIYERVLWQEREESSRNRCIECGVTVVEITPEEKDRFREAMAPVYEKYCRDDRELLEEIIRTGG